MSGLDDFRTWRANRRWQWTASEGDSRPLSRLEEKRYGRRAAREYAHVTAWRPCYAMGGRLCLRCLLREVTGINRRAKRRYVAEVHKRAASIPPSATIRFQKRPDGGWERAQ